MPTWRAIFSMLSPVARSSFTSVARRRAVGARPLYRPSTLALAIPSCWRSNIISRSNSATPPRMFSISFPVGVPVSMPRFSILIATDFPPIQLSFGFTLLHRPRQTVELGDDEGVALAGEFERRLEDIPRSGG